MKRSLYDVLGLDASASEEEVRKAYKTKAQTLHPDREGGDEEAFKELLEAYKTLSDATRRRYYDSTGTIPKDERNAFIMEAATVVLHLVDKGTSPEYVSVLSEAKKLVSAARDKYRSLLEQHHRVRAARISTAERITRKDGGENILSGIVRDSVSAVDEAVHATQELIEEADAVLSFLAEYDYRVTERPMTRSSVLRSWPMNAPFFDLYEE